MGFKLVEETHHLLVVNRLYNILQKDFLRLRVQGENAMGTCLLT
jgi:hypothetical protein